MIGYVSKGFVVVAVGCLAIGMSSCSVDQSTQTESKVSSVASPLGDNNVLYWQDKTDLFRATCVVGKPVNRANCTTNMLQLPVAEITKRSMTNSQRGIETVAAAITTEIKTLKGNDPTVIALGQQIAALTKQKPALETAVAATKAQVTADISGKSSLEERLVYISQQLKAVERELNKTPSDQILLDLQRDLRIDQIQSETKNVELAERLALSQKRLVTQQNILTKIDADLTAKQNELKLYSESLEVYSPRLDQLKAQKADADAVTAAVPKVLGFIADGTVMYRGSILPKELAAALVIVDRSFTSAAL